MEGTGGPSNTAPPPHASSQPHTSTPAETTPSTSSVAALTSGVESKSSQLSTSSSLSSIPSTTQHPGSSQSVAVTDGLSTSTPSTVLGTTTTTTSHNDNTTTSSTSSTLAPPSSSSSSPASSSLTTSSSTLKTSSSSAAVSQSVTSATSNPTSESHVEPMIVDSSSSSSQVLSTTHQAPISESNTTSTTSANPIPLPPSSSTTTTAATTDVRAEPDVSSSQQHPPASSSSSPQEQSMNNNTTSEPSSLSQSNPLPPTITNTSSSVLNSSSSSSRPSTPARQNNKGKLIGQKRARTSRAASRASSIEEPPTPLDPNAEETLSGASSAFPPWTRRLDSQPWNHPSWTGTTVEEARAGSRWTSVVSAVAWRWRWLKMQRNLALAEANRCLDKADTVHRQVKRARKAFSVLLDDDTLPHIGKAVQAAFESGLEGQHVTPKDYPSSRTPEEELEYEKALAASCDGTCIDKGEEECTGVCQGVQAFIAQSEMDAMVALSAASNEPPLYTPPNTIDHWFGPPPDEHLEPYPPPHPLISPPTTVYAARTHIVLDAKSRQGASNSPLPSSSKPTTHSSDTPATSPSLPDPPPPVPKPLLLVPKVPGAPQSGQVAALRSSHPHPLTPLAPSRPAATPYAAPGPIPLHTVLSAPPSIHPLALRRRRAQTRAAARSDRPVALIRGIVGAGPDHDGRRRPAPDEFVSTRGSAAAAAAAASVGPGRALPSSIYPSLPRPVANDAHGEFWRPVDISQIPASRTVAARAGAAAYEYALAVEPEKPKEHSTQPEDSTAAASDSVDADANAEFVEPGAKDPTHVDDEPARADSAPMDTSDPALDTSTSAQAPAPSSETSTSKETAKPSSDSVPASGPDADKPSAPTRSSDVPTDAASAPVENHLSQHAKAELQGKDLADSGIPQESRPLDANAHADADPPLSSSGKTVPGSGDVVKEELSQLMSPARATLSGSAAVTPLQLPTSINESPAVAIRPSSAKSASKRGRRPPLPPSAQALKTPRSGRGRGSHLLSPFAVPATPPPAPFNPAILAHTAMILSGQTPEFDLVSERSPAPEALRVAITGTPAPDPDAFQPTALFGADAALEGNEQEEPTPAPPEPLPPLLEMDEEVKKMLDKAASGFVAAVSHRAASHFPNSVLSRRRKSSVPNTPTSASSRSRSQYSTGYSVSVASEVMAREITLVKYKEIHTPEVRTVAGRTSSESSSEPSSSGPGPEASASRESSAPTLADMDLGDIPDANLGAAVKEPSPSVSSQAAPQNGEKTSDEPGKLSDSTSVVDPTDASRTSSAVAPFASSLKPLDSTAATSPPTTSTAELLDSGTGLDGTSATPMDVSSTENAEETGGQPEPGTSEPTKSEGKTKDEMNSARPSTMKHPQNIFEEEDSDELVALRHARLEIFEKKRHLGLIDGDGKPTEFARGRASELRKRIRRAGRTKAKSEAAAGGLTASEGPVTPAGGPETPKAEFIVTPTGATSTAETEREVEEATAPFLDAQPPENLRPTVLPDMHYELGELQRALPPASGWIPPRIRGGTARKPDPSKGELLLQGGFLWTPGDALPVAWEDKRPWDKDEPESVAFHESWPLPLFTGLEGDISLWKSTFGVNAVNSYLNTLGLSQDGRPKPTSIHVKRAEAVAAPSVEENDDETDATSSKDDDASSVAPEEEGEAAARLPLLGDAVTAEGADQEEEEEEEELSGDEAVLHEHLHGLASVCGSRREHRVVLSRHLPPGPVELPKPVPCASRSSSQEPAADAAEPMVVDSGGEMKQANDGSSSSAATVPPPKLLSVNPDGATTEAGGVIRESEAGATTAATTDAADRPVAPVDAQGGLHNVSTESNADVATSTAPMVAENAETTAAAAAVEPPAAAASGETTAMSVDEPEETEEERLQRLKGEETAKFMESTMAQARVPFGGDFPRITADDFASAAALRLPTRQLAESYWESKRELQRLNKRLWSLRQAAKKDRARQDGGSDLRPIVKLRRRRPRIVAPTLEIAEKLYAEALEAGTAFPEVNAVGEPMHDEDGVLEDNGAGNGGVP